MELVPVLYAPKASSVGAAFNLGAPQTNRNVISLSGGNSFGFNINIAAHILKIHL